MASRAKRVSRLKRTCDAFDIVSAEPFFTLWLNLGRLIGYLESNDRYLVNYARRHYKGLPISSSIAASAVNEVVSFRMAKKRQMRWSYEGTHLLAQVRVHVLNGDLHPGQLPHRYDSQSRYANPITTLASSSRQLSPRFGSLSFTAAHPQHKVYPYLLRGVPVVRANQVWSTDITYVRLERGFAYLVAVIDWYSRRVLSWRISNTMDAAFSVDCLEDALREHGKPEVFNSDQGSQFTSDDFTGVLKREHITISMDGRGRAYDNIFVERLWRSVKHEDVYLHGYSGVGELLIGLTKYFAFYNAERAHQSLGNQTPQEVHETSSGGGAMIVDKYRTKQRLPVALRSSGTAFEEVRNDIWPAIPNAKIGAAPTSCEKSSAT